jgi:hypothetical protein
MVILPDQDPVQLGMRKLCCICHSRSIAALIYIIVLMAMVGSPFLSPVRNRSMAGTHVGVARPACPKQTKPGGISH